jgi:hypothetical protein
MDRRLPEKVRELREQYSFQDDHDSELHSALTSYCRFVVKAKVHEGVGRFDEAFLHYVIALDLLFGDKDMSTQKIAKRTAVVTARAQGLSHSDSVSIIKDYYDRRSRYVHAGKSVGAEHLEGVRTTSAMVLRCLLRLQGIEANRQRGFLEQWLKTLDFLAAAEEVNRPIPDADLLSAGLSLTEEEQETPLRTRSVFL